MWSTVQSILPNNLLILLNVEGFFCTHKIGSYAFTWVCFDRIDEITSVVDFRLLIDSVGFIFILM